jgi:hypothetical protein
MLEASKNLSFLPISSDLLFRHETAFRLTAAIRISSHINEMRLTRPLAEVEKDRMVRPERRTTAIYRRCSLH